MSLKISRFFCVLALTCVAFVAQAQFVAGKDYVVMKNSLQDDIPEIGVSVIEFFNYGCPACYRFEPVLQTWLDNHSSAVNFSRVPVVFNPDWQFYAKAYYVAEILDLTVQLDDPLFEQVQENGQAMANVDVLVNFIVERTEVDKQLVEDTFASSDLVKDLDNGKRLMRAYRVNAIPGVVIGGIYKTDLRMAGNDTERLLKIMDYLLEKSGQQPSTS